MRSLHTCIYWGGCWTYILKFLKGYNVAVVDGEQSLVIIGLFMYSYRKPKTPPVCLARPVYNSPS